MRVCAAVLAALFTSWGVLVKLTRPFYSVFLHVPTAVRSGAALTGTRHVCCLLLLLSASSWAARAALAATGTIWTRWSFVITPVNWNLATANVFVACTGIYQLQRVYRAGRSGTPADATAAAATEPPPPVPAVPA